MAAAPRRTTSRRKFEAAAAAAKQTKKKPDNATLLKLYSYYKQATDGDVKGDRPGGFDFVGGAKYDAWSKLKGMSARRRDDQLHQAGGQAQPRVARSTAATRNEKPAGSGGLFCRTGAAATIALAPRAFLARGRLALPAAGSGAAFAAGFLAFGPRRPCGLPVPWRTVPRPSP